MSKNHFQTLIDTLLKNDRFIITTHTHPDPDGIGALLGVTHLLRSGGKDVLSIIQEPLTKRLRFLDPERIIKDIKFYINDNDLYDRTVVLVDTYEPNRVGDIAKFIHSDKSNLLVIDHHQFEADYLKYFIFPERGSTAEIVYEVLSQAGLEIPILYARAIYAGIVTDSGGFRFAKTTPRTHQIAGELLKTGIRPEEVSEFLYNQSPLTRLIARKELYRNVSIISDQGLAYFKIKKEDLDAIGAAFEDIDGLVNELLEVDAIRAGILFTERAPLVTKVSVRSKASYNMLPAVSAFMGGGHKNACGATIEKDLEEAIKLFLPYAMECVKGQEDVI